MEAQWVRDQLPAHCRKVLDLGCGIGALFPTIGISRVIGLDLNSDGLAHTRDRFQDIPLTCGGVEKLPFTDRAVDAITLQHVIEHLDAADRAAREWRRVLKPGGVALILTPNAAFADPSVFDDPTHVHLYSGGGLAELLRSAGFEIVDVRSIGLPWFRGYAQVRSGWRLRRFVTHNAQMLSSLPGLRWRGQTLCCTARRPGS
jgi:ubiquinone/menaquinone biosynthesis C-methylase UbiE